jgi:hypothetical protein
MSRKKTPFSEIQSTALSLFLLTGVKQNDWKNVDFADRVCPQFFS